MKYTVLVLALTGLILTAGCRNRSAVNKTEENDTTEVEEVSNVPVFDQIFPGLYSYLHGQDSSFQPSKFEEGATLEKPDSSALSVSMDELKAYAPYFIYNQ